MWRWILAIVLCLLYLRSPIDLIPDFLRPWGFLDDIGVLALAWWWLKKKAKQRAAEEFRRMANASSASNKETSDDPSRSERKTARDPTEVLGVANNASPDEIEAAYKKLMKQYHPDRVHGLGEELQEIAREKTKEINDAYSKLRQ